VVANTRNPQKHRFQGREDGGMEMRNETAIIYNDNVHRLSGGKSELSAVK
jgi:hypothetical protein